MRDIDARLVAEALMVSEELIRVAILWSEQWHEGLEEASKLYAEHDIDGMFAILRPLHKQIQNPGSGLTKFEDEFVQLYSKDIKDAWEWCKKYERTGNTKELNSAWDHYYHVYRRIAKSLDHLSSLELKDVSPKLLAARNLKLAVPGVY